jgi:hypothetical protein
MKNALFSNAVFEILLASTIIVVAAAYDQNGGHHHHGGGMGNNGGEMGNGGGGNTDGSFGNAMGYQTQNSQQKQDKDRFYGGYHHHCSDCSWQGDHYGGNENWSFANQSWVELNDCGEKFACNLPRGGIGTFVCRETFHPMNQEVHTMATCIPTDKAWETDICGCCGDVCPERLQFTNISCHGQEENMMDHNGEYNERSAMVCRHLFDPYTGDRTLETTLIIPYNHALDDDMCGCCDGNCSMDHGWHIPRPDFSVNVTCQGDELITCQHHGQTMFNGSTTVERSSMGFSGEGQFVCREWFNVRTGHAKRESVCVHPDRTWDSDVCGCCEDRCPDLPFIDELECPESDRCDLDGSSEPGVFVCRSIFHPVTGQLYDRSFCIPRNNAWVTDTCGCCSTGQCPEAPAGGFDDEEAQLVRLALESPDDFATQPGTIQSNGVFSDSAASFFARDLLHFGISLLLVLVAA